MNSTATLTTHFSISRTMSQLACKNDQWICNMMVVLLAIFLGAGLVASEVIAKMYQ